MFRFFWLKRFLRKHTRAMAGDTAVTWKKRMSFLYMFFAWNALGLILFKVLSSEPQKKDEGTSGARYWTNKLHIKDATVYKVSGMSVKKFDIHNEFDDEDLKDECEETLDGENMETS